MPEPTNREILENLHKTKRIKKTDIRPIKESFEQTGTASPAQNIASIEDRMKAETNALVAIFIEEIWLKTLEVMEKNPPGLATIIGTPLTNSEIRSKLLWTKNADEVANTLNAGSKDLLKKQIADWYKMRQERWKKGMHIPDNGGDLKDKAYDRYFKLLMVEGEKSPDTQILAGVLTALNVIWGLIKILPKVYEAQFNKKMPTEKLEKLADNSISLIYALAGSHLRMFVGIEKEMIKERRLQMYDSLEANDFDSDRFQFVGDEENPRLEIKPHILQNVQPLETLQAGTVRTGCPAIYAIGPSHRNIIAEMYDWSLKLVKEYYLPALEKEQESNQNNSST